MQSSVRSKAEVDHDFDIHDDKDDILDNDNDEECHMIDRFDPDGEHKRSH